MAVLAEQQVRVLAVVAAAVALQGAVA